MCGIRSANFFHYACTPMANLSNGRVRVGASELRVWENMKARAAYAKDIPTELLWDDDRRIHNAAEAAAFYTRVVFLLPLDPHAFHYPCCGCGHPTTSLCACGDAYFCVNCEHNDHFALLQTTNGTKFVGDKQSFLERYFPLGRGMDKKRESLEWVGRCRKCLCKTQEEAGLRAPQRGGKAGK